MIFSLVFLTLQLKKYLAVTTDLLISLIMLHTEDFTERNAKIVIGQVFLFLMRVLKFDTRVSGEATLGLSF